jgi:hypothetical protein
LTILGALRRITAELPPKFDLHSRVHCGDTERGVNEAANCDWSHELDSNGVLESVIGQVLGSDVAGTSAGRFEEFDRVSKVRDESGGVKY